MDSKQKYSRGKNPKSWKNSPFTKGHKPYNGIEKGQFKKGSKGHWKGGKIKKICWECKKEYDVFPIRKNSKFCSLKCYHKYGRTVAPWNKGINKSIKKVGENRQFKKGHTPWNKGKNAKFCEICGTKTPRNSTKYCSMNCFKIGFKGRNTWSKGRKLTPEHIKKSLGRRKMSSLEAKMLMLIQKLNLPYKFTGNGGVLIGRKCPDFVNTNGEKIAIEVYYRRHKEVFSGVLETWKQERTKIFGEYGWKILYFDETQVNEEEIKRRIG